VNYRGDHKHHLASPSISLLLSSPPSRPRSTIRCAGRCPTPGSAGLQSSCQRSEDRRPLGNQKKIRTPRGRIHSVRSLEHQDSDIHSSPHGRVVLSSCIGVFALLVVAVGLLDNSPLGHEKVLPTRDPSIYGGFTKLTFQ